MAHAKMTLIGYYNYLDAVSVDLFAALKDMPAGIDKNILEDNILLQGGEFEVLFADPYFLKQAIEPWVKKYYRTFDKWVKALDMEYDPLSNYDRHEEWTDKHTGTVVGEGKTETDGVHEGSNEDTTTTKVSAYDTDDFANNNQVTGGGWDHSEDNTTTESGTKTTNDLEDKRTGRAWGNIGVTTSQQMLQSELDVAEWNLYEHITDLFIQEFCIPVYI